MVPWGTPGRRACRLIAPHRNWSLASVVNCSLHEIGPGGTPRALTTSTRSIAGGATAAMPSAMPAPALGAGTVGGALEGVGVVGSLVGAGVVVGAGVLTVGAGVLTVGTGVGCGVGEGVGGGPLKPEPRTYRDSTMSGNALSKWECTE